MAIAEQIQDQIDRNYTAFKALLPDLMKTSGGKWALLHNATLEGVFDTARGCMVGRHEALCGWAFLRPGSQEPGRGPGTVLSCRVLAGSTTLSPGFFIICQGVFMMDFSGRFSFSI